MPYRRRLATLAVALAACTAADRPDGFTESTSALFDDGNGPYVLVKRSQTRCFFVRGDDCVDSIPRATSMLDNVTAGTLDEEWSAPFPKRINVSDGSAGSGVEADDLSLGDLVGQQNADRVSASWSGFIGVPPAAAPNTWSFVVGSDDGFRLRVFDGTTTQAAEVSGGRSFDWGVPDATGKRTLVVTFPPAGGRFPFELTWFEATGGAGVEFRWKQGEFATYDAQGWSLVPVSAMASPDLRVSLTAERTGGGLGDLQAGDTVTWTAVVRNAGAFTIHPQSGGSLPGGVSREGIAFSTCLANNLQWVGFDRLPTGAVTDTTTNGCRNRRIYAFLPGPLAPGESRTLTYKTTVGGFGVFRICNQGVVVASTTDRADIGRNRIQRVTDDPTTSSGDDTGNARRTFDPNGAADDDQTCVRVGEPLPVFTLDTPSPAETIVTNRPTAAGTARAGARVVVTLAGPNGATAACEATSDALGHWSCRVARPVVDGAWTFTARIVDAAGNEGASLSVQAYVSTPPPGAPLLDVITSPTSDPYPRVTGTVGAFETVTIRDEAGRVVCTTEAREDGRFDCPSTEAFTEGPHTVRATATDVNGRNGPASAAATFTVDLSGPPPPRFSAPLPLTNERRPVFAGTSEAGSRVIVQQNSTTLCDTTADASGAFSCTCNRDLPDGPTVVTGLAIDALGNPGSRGTHAFRIDATAPLPPVMDPLADVVTDPQPVFSGTAEPGSTVAIRPVLGDGSLGPALCSVAASDTGAFTCRPVDALAQGTWIVEAEATDAATNASARCQPGAPCTNQDRFTIDDGPPAPPLFDSLPTVLTRFSSLSGSAERGGTVVIRNEAGDVVCVAIAVDGRFSCDFTPFADGVYTLVARVTDVLGIESEATSVTVTVDSTPPAPPTLDPMPARTNVVLPTFSGRAEGRSTVRVMRGSEVVCEGPSGLLGNYFCTPAAPLADGDYRIVAIATDLAGNVSAPSDPVEFTLDSTPPAAPHLLELGSPTPLARPVFSGTAEPGATISVSSRGSVVCETTVDASGAFACTPGADLTDGDYVFTATATDAFGNTSTPSTPLRLTVDAAPPAAPVIDPPEGPTRDQTPEVRGSAEPGARVTLSEGTTDLCSVRTTDAGRWACSPAEDLGDGDHVLTARATDLLGRTGPDSAPVTIRIDLSPPPPPVLTAPLTDERLTTLRLVAGTASEAVEVELFLDGDSIGSVVVQDGAFSFAGAEDFLANAIGTHTLFAVATDEVGNRGGPSATVSFQILGFPVLGGGGCGCAASGVDGVLGAVLLAALRRRRR